MPPHVSIRIIPDNTCVRLDQHANTRVATSKLDCRTEPGALQLRRDQQPDQRRAGIHLTPENLLASITSGGVTETYSADANSERVTRTIGDATTVYLGALKTQAGGAVKRS